MSARVLALDAMGVIYCACDDVQELLIPFVKARGGNVCDARIANLYLEASLGSLSAREFWYGVGCDPALEDEYLAQHELRPGLLSLLADASRKFEQIWCVSNDLSEWSSKLRVRLGLEQWFDGWLISGDLGLRKPSLEVYAALDERTRVAARDVLFVDDRRANLDAAAAHGWNVIHFALESRADAASCSQLWAQVLGA